MEMVEKVSASFCNNNGEKEQQLDEDDIPLPGFRFHPTDEELVGYYLKRKVEKKPIRLDLIKHIDVYKFEPWDLPKQVNTCGEREWYFFCRRGRKYKNSIRPNRVTGSGFWKATGIDKPIYAVGGFSDCIGLKKSLVYYRGSAGKGTKTDWMMHEFRLPTKNSSTSTLTNTKNCNVQEAEVWTLCRIFKREVSFKKYASDWRKLCSKQSLSDSSSKSSISASDNNYRNHDNHDSFEASYDEVINLTPPVNFDDHFCQSNLQCFADQQSLTTHQVPFMASYLSFSSRNGDHEAFKDGSWDELRPMVEFAVDPSFLYSYQ